MEKNRLSKILSRAGVNSRRACEKIIESGRVKVNGNVITLPQHFVDPQKDRILLDGKPVICGEKTMSFLLNKPKGYICTNQDQARDRRKVIDLFKDINLRLFTVGRLDKDTSGLLIVTNDGQLSHSIIHPSFNLEKEYLIKIRQEVSDDLLKAMQAGVVIDRKHVKPIRLKKVRKGTFKMSVKEGKKHEVRLIVKQAGAEVLELKRIRIGPLNLPHLLKEGEYREMKPSELALFGTHDIL